jgi:16S rRNA U1498 N3-methylase RsmE
MDAQRQKKSHRFNERARKAALQSRRGIVPKVLEAKVLEEAIKVCEDAELKLVCRIHEKEEFEPFCTAGKT